MINEDMCIASSPPARLSVAAADGAAVHAHAAVLAAAPVVDRQLHGVTRVLACFILFAVAHVVAALLQDRTSLTQQLPGLRAGVCSQAGG